MQPTPPPPLETPDVPGVPRPLRRGLVHAVAWLLATGAAVTLSWWGVHTVMSGTAYDPPRALPVVAADASDSASPLASSTHRPQPSPSATPSRPSAGPSTPRRTPSTTPRPSTSSPGTAPSGNGGNSGNSGDAGNVKSYATAGGRAVFDLGETSATLVSATPGAGWSVQVWKQTTWIRVEFTSGNQRVSVFCTWHDHRPSVEIATY
ncbi:hypothetical protein OKJ48_38260 [Streptomyces kunmingensis]|uniref:Secreted protein n=1 Tax=Streptomyces kunmingensis TaxID=68225 RepID=A0ABU6CMT4_9ACTN|nr:hypothetical protein [Streptomyces kunmingensis]MEB3966026.1 hypothetical protein [Streptomyces kunmingensis]